MKILLTIFTLVFTVMFSSKSFAEWTKVSSSGGGTTFYVDFERIRKHDGLVYWWSLTKYSIPLRGYVSDKTYYQGDCKLYRFKSLSVSSHKEPMGGGIGRIRNKQDKEWRYTPPNSPLEMTLKSVCSR